MEIFAYTCMPPMISALPKAIFIELLKPMAEATDFGIRSTASGDTRGYVEFYPAHDPFR